MQWGRYLFAALTMISVGKAAAEIIQEVRDQFANYKNENGFLLGDCIRKYTEMYEVRAHACPERVLGGFACEGSMHPVAETHTHTQLRAPHRYGC